jgi:hypothetical protein
MSARGLVDRLTSEASVEAIVARATGSAATAAAAALRASGARTEVVPTAAPVPAAGRGGAMPARTRIPVATASSRRAASRRLARSRSPRAWRASPPSVPAREGHGVKAAARAGATRHRPVGQRPAADRRATIAPVRGRAGAHRTVLHGVRRLLVAEQRATDQDRHPPRRAGRGVLRRRDLRGRDRNGSCPVMPTSTRSSSCSHPSSGRLLTSWSSAVCRRFGELSRPRGSVPPARR